MQEKWLVISSYHQTQVEEKEECNIMMVVKLYHSNSASIRLLVWDLGFTNKTLLAELLRIFWLIGGGFYNNNWWGNSTY